MKGHFKLSSGLHSGEYLQCALVLQHPEYAKRLCRALAGKFKDKKPTVVAAPALGGIVVSYEVASALKCRSIFLERQNGVMTFRRGFDVTRSDRVLAVEDVVTTGGSTKEVLGALREKGAQIIGVGVIIDRSCTEPDFGVDFRYLHKLNIETFNPQECPFCKKGIPVVKPGSR